jgi:hypothetical protein
MEPALPGGGGGLISSAKAGIRLPESLDIDIDIIFQGRLMATEQLLLRLPEDLVRKFRQTVPERQRSAFVRTLLEQALAADPDEDSDPLYLAALAVEQDGHLSTEMAEWQEATLADGLEEIPSH